MIYITTQDIVSNALIELITHQKTKRVFFNQLNMYATCVLKELNKNENKYMLLTSKSDIYKLLIKYPNYFELFTEGIKEGILLRDIVCIDDLYKMSRSNMPISILKAFLNASDALYSNSVH